MLLSSVLVGVALATASQASPMERDPKSLHEEIVHFKRDSVISARDLELAEMHQVNLTESKLGQSNPSSGAIVIEGLLLILDV